MKKLSLLLLTFFIFSASYCQTVEEYLNSGADKGLAGDWNAAIADYNKAIELDPDLTYSYYMRGLAKTMLKDYEGGISDITKFIASEPNESFAYDARGRVKSLLGDHQGALADYSKAIELATEPDPKYYSSRGDVFRTLASYEGAISDYTRAIDLLPVDDPSLGFIYYQRGYCKVMIDQMEGCLDLGKSILLGFEADLYCSVKNAEDYKADGDLKVTNGDYKRGIADYDKAIELEPNDNLVYVARGSAKYNIKDYIGAIADFTKSIELNEKPNTAVSYHRRALSKFQLADYGGAMQDLDRATEDDELNWEYPQARGILKIQLGENENACADLKKALELGSTTADQWIHEYCK
jgi:tetratricopeptide (TPR) repeat protein